MKEFFDWVPVVNLARREDRLVSFQAGMPENWPFRQPERFEAIDGLKTLFPGWWKQGKGAWGAMMSHIRVVETALNRGYRNVLVFEDDATFGVDFSVKAPNFVNMLPKGWDGFYLGGQHLVPPLEEGGVFRCQNINRLHAYGFTQKYAQTLYKHLCEWPEHSRKTRHHVDHRHGLLQSRGVVRVYAPREWLVGQAEGFSDLLRKDTPERFWEKSSKRKARTNVVPAIAVVGPWGSGTSLVAGILRALGVHMGNKFFKTNDPRTPNSFEAVALRQTLMEYFVEPTAKARATIEAQHLQGWIKGRRREARAKKKTACGGKHAFLSMCVPQVLEAWDPVKIVRVRRDRARLLATLHRRGWWKTPEYLAGVGLIESTLDEHETIDIQFEHLIVRPAATVKKLVEELGLTPSASQVANAIGMVRQ